jgi:multidrug efflux system outer membrane protein
MLLTGLTACAVGPNYKRPETTPVATTWRDSAQAGRDSSFANVPWWTVFNDDTLQTLIRRALKENRDVHIALARVNEARALLGIQRLEYFPQINVQGGVRKSDGADSLLTGVTNSEMGYVGVGLSWELDLWGRLRRLNEAAAAELLARAGVQA